MRGAALAAALAALAPSSAMAVRVERMAGIRPGKPVEVVSGEAIVRFDPSAAPAARAAALAAVGARVLQENVDSAGSAHISFSGAMTVAAVLQQLRSAPGVLLAEPNRAYRPNRVPNDPQTSNQYHLSRTNAFPAWEYEVGASSLVTVAIIDTGIDGSHADLASKIVAAQNCSGGACVPEAGGAPVPVCNHATRVAGVAAALTDNGFGVAGMSWGAKLASLRVFSAGTCAPDCSGALCVSDDARVLNALSYAATTLQGSASAGHVVVNISLGDTGGAPCSAPLQAGITAAVGQGLVIVASVGNEGGALDAPANCAGVIPVAATDSNDNPASFSNSGPELASFGLAAPGVGIVTSDLGGGVTNGATGTSFAAPQVSGVAALLLAQKPLYTPAQVQNVLRASADSLGSPYSMGAGRLNAFRALRLAINGTLSNFEGDSKAIAFPNPFRPGQHGTVTITVPTGLQGSPAQIRIYTFEGQFIRELTGQTWDGRNDSGREVASGTYVFVVKTEAGLARGRIGLIR